MVLAAHSRFDLAVKLVHPRQGVLHEGALVLKKLVVGWGSKGRFHRGEKFLGLGPADADDDRPVELPVGDCYLLPNGYRASFHACQNISPLFCCQGFLKA